MAVNFLDAIQLANVPISVNLLECSQNTLGKKCFATLFLQSIKVV
ncbi:hypothetical protein Xen7305DRAFT_00040750 [Xenococcus sp. PCC 7305]|nr:hypothetical protein Xen7305DRAFT_00040750 [Xenococcus sp. PCC 7305]